MHKRLSLFALCLSLLLLVLVSGDALAQNGPRLWFAEFWPNADQEGEPVARHSTGVLDYDWESGSPANVPDDYFSARWTTYAEFAPGTYRFTTTSDDGVRVWLDGHYIIDEWEEQEAAVNEAVVSLQGGLYPLAVDYYEAEGDARLRFTWERIGPPQHGDQIVVEPTPTPAAPPAQTEVTGTTLANLRLRQGPGTAYQILDVAPAGTTVPVLARTAANDWVQVEYEGQVGWMAVWYLSLNNTIQTLPVAP